MKIETRRDREHARRQATKIAPAIVARSRNPIKLRPLMYVMGFGALAFIGTLFQEMAYGQLLIVIYGVLAIAAKIPSDQTFKMSLVTLGCLLLLVILGNFDIAKSFASYTFLFFAIGLITATIERRHIKQAGKGEYVEN